MFWGHELSFDTLRTFKNSILEIFSLPSTHHMTLCPIAEFSLEPSLPPTMNRKEFHRSQAKNFSFTKFI